MSISYKTEVDVEVDDLLDLLAQDKEALKEFVQFFHARAWFDRTKKEVLLAFCPQDYEYYDTECLRSDLWSLLLSEIDLIIECGDKEDRIKDSIEEANILKEGLQSIINRIDNKIEEIKTLK